MTGDTYFNHPISSTKPHSPSSPHTIVFTNIALLFVTAASGLLLALLKSTPALPLLLCIHLGSVMAFFLTMPYGKFAHGAYRCAALLKWAIEKRRPLAPRLGTD